MKIAFALFVTSLFVVGNLQGEKPASSTSVDSLGVAVSSKVLSIPVQSEVVPVASLLDKAELNRDEASAISKAMKGSDVDFVPEALVVLTAEGLAHSEELDNGSLLIALVDQTGDLIDREIELRPNTLQIPDFSSDEARIDRYELKVLLPSINEEALLHLWTLTYSSYAIERSIAHSSAGLTTENGGAIDYSNRRHVFGYLVREKERLYPVYGELHGNSLQLTSAETWNVAKLVGDGLQKIHRWDTENTLPLFDEWNALRRRKKNVPEDKLPQVEAELTRLVELTIERKQGGLRKELADEVTSSIAGQDFQTIELAGTSESGVELLWEVDLDSGIPFGGDLSFKLRGWNNNSDPLQKRAHYMHWVEVHGLPDEGTKPVVGVFSEYIKNRSNRTFACEGIPVDELHLSLAGQDLDFIQADFYEGSLDIVKLFSLKPSDHGGYDFNILYWYRFRDSTHGKSFLDISRQLRSKTNLRPL